MNIDTNVRPFYASWLWLIPAAGGAIITALTLFVLPPDRTLHGLVDFAFKVSPLLLAVLAIALFPQHSPWLRWLMLLGFVFYMGYVDSAFILQVDKLAAAAVAGEVQKQFPTFYTFNLFVNSFTLLFALLAYRLGGGSATNVIKLGCAAILVTISGLNDLTMWAMYPWPAGERPFVFDWASHVAIFIGRDPNLYHMIGFLAVHLALAVTIVLLPLQRRVGALSARRNEQIGADTEAR